MQTSTSNPVARARSHREAAAHVYVPALAPLPCLPLFLRMPLAWAEFTTLRQGLLKNLLRTRSGGGARVVEKAAGVRIHFASACPNAALFRLLAGRLATSGP